MDTSLVREIKLDCIKQPGLKWFTLVFLFSQVLLYLKIKPNVRSFLLTDFRTVGIILGNYHLMASKSNTKTNNY